VPRDFLGGVFSLDMRGLFVIGSPLRSFEETGRGRRESLPLVFMCGREA
jgi:hypothetical protein